MNILDKITDLCYYRKTFNNKKTCNNNIDITLNNFKNIIKYHNIKQFNKNINYLNKNNIVLDKAYLHILINYCIEFNNIIIFRHILNYIKINNIILSKVFITYDK